LIHENNKPFFRYANGGACFTDFDYNLEDGKTYYCENDSFNQKIEKNSETAKYYLRAAAPAADPGKKKRGC
jgi:hypothetical protein